MASDVVDLTLVVFVSVVLVVTSSCSDVMEIISWFSGDHCGKVVLVEVASSPGTKVVGTSE